jgi:hypothetical protein
MDLSSLQNTLPKGRKPSPPPSLPPPALTADFKAAALAVTKLYQNSAKQIDHARQEGYLLAVQEVASLLSGGELAGDRLREWCAVGLSRITAQQDEENRRRPEEREEDRPSEEERPRETLTPSVSSPVLSTRMQLPSQQPPHPFDTEFTFSAPVAEFGGFVERREQEVTYEVIDGREGTGTGRKRGVNHQLGSIWDVGGGKRSRHG